jgi:hypothetical protein
MFRYICLKLLVCYESMFLSYVIPVFELYNSEFLGDHYVKTVILCTFIMGGTGWWHCNNMFCNDVVILDVRRETWKKQLSTI